MNACLIIGIVVVVHNQFELLIAIVICIYHRHHAQALNFVDGRRVLHRQSPLPPSYSIFESPSRC